MHVSPCRIKAHALKSEWKPTRCPGHWMSRARGGGGLKRRRDEPGGDLTKDECSVYNLIQSKGNMGIWKGDVKRELKTIQAKVIDNCIKNLKTKAVIKEVVNVHSKGKSRLMAMDIEPSTELTGGVWYSVEGNLDEGLIDSLNEVCLQHVRRSIVTTAEGIHNFVRTNALTKQIFKVEISLQQIKEILSSMVLDNTIIELKSTGYGEFLKFPSGSLCYKLNKKAAAQQGPRTGALASIPCGVCPRINQCSPGGVISPITCSYYAQWLDF
ncbi:hypothetical protein Dimus_031292 [Dionaea muscipula]